MVMNPSTFDSKRGNVFLLELPGKMSFDKRCLCKSLAACITSGVRPWNSHLSSTPISDKNQFEGRNVLSLCHDLMLKSVCRCLRMRCYSLFRMEDVNVGLQREREPEYGKICAVPSPMM